MAAPGPLTAAALADQCVADLPTTDLLDVVAGFERLTSWSQAGALAAIAELDRRFDPPRPEHPSAADPGVPDPNALYRGPLDPGAAADPRVPSGVQRLAAELGCLLTISEQAARLRIDLAKTLHGRLPWVADALAAGTIDPTRARAFAAETDHLDPGDAAEVTLPLMPAAGRLTAGQLRHRLRAAALTRNPEAAERRRRRAAREHRGVSLIPDRDGLACLSATLTEGEASVSYALIEQAARALAAADRAAGLPRRPIDQARADALVDLINGRTQPTPSSQPTQSGQSSTCSHFGHPTTLITITVPLAALLAGLTGPDDIPHHNPDHSSPNDTSPDHSSPEDSSPVEYGADDGAPPLAWTLAGLDRPMPGELSGLGPVTPATAREATLNALDRLRHLAGGRVGVRWIAIDHHGHATAVTGTSYTPPPLLRSALQARDRTCRFPGCTRPAHHCDCDHIQPYPTGPTTTTNTTSLCRAHHRLKTHSGWTLTPDHTGTGTLTWTSPTGHSYRTHPGLWTDPTNHPSKTNPPTTNHPTTNHHHQTQP